LAGYWSGEYYGRTGICSTTLQTFFPPRTLSPSGAPVVPGGAYVATCSSLDARPGTIPRSPAAACAEASSLPAGDRPRGHRSRPADSGHGDPGTAEEPGWLAAPCPAEPGD